jgi:hypothetical protein
MSQIIPQSATRRRVARAFDLGGITKQWVPRSFAFFAKGL